MYAKLIHDRRYEVDQVLEDIVKIDLIDSVDEVLYFFVDDSMSDIKVRVEYEIHRG